MSRRDDHKSTPTTGAVGNTTPARGSTLPHGTSPNQDRDEYIHQLEKQSEEDRNADPLSGEAGAHPAGTGLGAAFGGAVAGAAIGSLTGPVGTVLGTVVGGVAGGLAGKAVAENIDPTVEADYWREAYRERPYYSERYTYDDYEPAYRAGWESYDPDVSVAWNEREQIARQRWEGEGGAPTMTWEEARQASEDAYNRVHQRRIQQRHPK